MYHLEITAVYGIVEAERQVTGMAKRIGSVDILKALGICSVILYHTEALPTVVNGWIGSYFMPLFFFASGLTFSAKQPKFGAFLKKKSVYLLLPYLLYLVCCAAVGVAKQVIRGVAFPVKSFLLGAVSGLPNMNEYTGRAWFIYCFFVAEILFYFLLKWTKGKRTPLFLAALISLLAGYAYAHFFRDSAAMIWRYTDGMVAVFFMTVGYLLRESVLKLKAPGLLFIVPSVGFGLINLHINSHGLVMAYSYYGELVPMVVSALSGCLFFAALSNCLQSRYLEYLGQNTLFIYLFHFFLWAYPLPRLLGKVMTVGTTAYNWLYALLLFAEVLLIFSLLIPVYNRIMQPLQRRLFGKKNEK